MIQVTKEELNKLREKFPDLRATRTVHKYYIEENPKVMAALRKQVTRGGKHHA